MKKIVVIADFFTEHVLGGGELNNEELIDMFREEYDVDKKQSHNVTLDYLSFNKGAFFIVSNFVNLSLECREFLTKLNYVIYEHDHKYLKSRNPATYKGFKAPPSEIINYRFYREATAVLCQSAFHKMIVQKNLNINNIINLGGNLWSVKSLELMRRLNKNKKENACSILDSKIKHKNTADAIKFCNLKKIKYNLISSDKYHVFLEKLSLNEKFVFFPKTPETLSRVVVEARMLGCSVITNKMVGATSEPWFNLKGDELIDFMVNKRNEIFSLIVALSKKSKNKKEPKISIISTFHEGEQFLNDFMENITNQSIFDVCELVIVDAASKGAERQIIDKYRQQFDNIKYIRVEEKLLPSPCLNIAVQNSSGKYLTYGFIDDHKKQNGLEMLYEYIVDKQADLVYGNTAQISNKSEIKKKTNIVLFEHSTFPFSKENMVKCLPGPMPLWDYKIHEKSGFFDNVNCNYADDWEMWLRAVNDGFVFCKLNKVVGHYLIGGRSQQNNIEQRQEEARIFFKYSHLFGSNFHKYKNYFNQFLRSK